MTLTITELSLLVIAGLAAATYAKSEQANSFVAALVGLISSVLIYLVVRR